MLFSLLCATPPHQNPTPLAFIIMCNIMCFMAQCGQRKLTKCDTNKIYWRAREGVTGVLRELRHEFSTKLFSFQQ